MNHCPSCHAEVTETDLQAEVCTQCGYSLRHLTFEELLNEIGQNKSCMELVRRRLSEPPPSGE